MPTIRTAFEEAVQSRQAKRAFPTSLKSAALERLSLQAPDIMERAMVSAQVANVDILDEINKQITRMVSGLSSGAGDYSNPVTVHAALLDFIQKTGYQPEAGKEGTIEDLTSDKRINLITQMNADDARGYGQYEQGQDPDVLDEWPCLELYRLEDRKEKRPWAQRWRAAGGKFYGKPSAEFPEGRMIARKDDPVWAKISRFGKPYPPFDYGSGMWTRQIDRDESIELEVIQPNDQVQSQSRGFNEDFDFNAANQKLNELITEVAA